MFIEYGTEDKRREKSSFSNEGDMVSTTRPDKIMPARRLRQGRGHQPSTRLLKDRHVLL